MTFKDLEAADVLLAKRIDTLVDSLRATLGCSSAELYYRAEAVFYIRHIERNSADPPHFISCRSVSGFDMNEFTAEDFAELEAHCLKEFHR